MEIRVNPAFVFLAWVVGVYYALMMLSAAIHIVSGLRSTHLLNKHMETLAGAVMAEGVKGEPKVGFDTKGLIKR